jgi:hypothetical protein
MSKKQVIKSAIASRNNSTFSIAEIAAETDTSIPYVNNVVKTMVAKGELNVAYDGNRKVYSMGEIDMSTITSTSSVTSPVESNVVKLSDIASVTERFSMIENFVEMVTSKKIPSFLLTGMSGVGKSHTVTETLEKLGLTRGEDYVVCKCKASPGALYTVLHDNRDSIIVFDDCDSVLRDETSRNVLKGAVDSYDERIVEWNSSWAEKNDLEASFEFTGGVIFISNMNASRIDSAVRSRTVCVDFQMSRDELIEHLYDIAEYIQPNVDFSVKQEVLNFIDEEKTSFREFNIRTFIKSLNVRLGASNGNCWKKMTKIMDMSS